MTVTPQTNATLEQLADLFRANDDFVICGHVSPDGDCLGSQLALAHALTALGKRSTCVLVRDEPVGRALSFIPGIQDMVPAERYEGPCSVFVGVDVPSRERIGEAACKLLDASDVSVTIDHHACDEPMCQHVYVDPDSASTSILIWEIVKLLLDEPPVECAECAYVGLMTDTGCFRFQNANSQAFLAAADLLDHGVEPAGIASQVYQNRSMASLELEAFVIGRMEPVSNGQGAISWIDEEDFILTGAVKADAEPLVDVIRSISGVRVACMLRAQDGVVRGSLRAKDDTDVSVLARKFGGGGHAAAAGFTLDISVREAVPVLKAEIAQILK